MTKQAVFAFILGLTFLLVLAYAALRQGAVVDAHQFYLLRVIASVSGAGVAAILPGFLELDVGMGAKFAIRAGGALAVFLALYRVNPPELVVPVPYSSAERNAPVTAPVVPPLVARSSSDSGATTGPEAASSRGARADESSGVTAGNTASPARGVRATIRDPIDRKRLAELLEGIVSLEMEQAKTENLLLTACDEDQFEQLVLNAKAILRAASTAEDELAKADKVIVDNFPTYKSLRTDLRRRREILGPIATMRRNACTYTPDQKTADEYAALHERLISYESDLLNH